jgi:hypothetical protein
VGGRRRARPRRDGGECASPFPEALTEVGLSSCREGLGGSGEPAIYVLEK